jgi:hypothetical protein
MGTNVKVAFYPVIHPEHEAGVDLAILDDTKQDGRTFIR